MKSSAGGWSRWRSSVCVGGGSGHVMKKFKSIPLTPFLEWHQILAPFISDRTDKQRKRRERIISRIENSEKALSIHSQREGVNENLKRMSTILFHTSSKC